MKIIVQIVVEIDANQWAELNGLESKSDVRADVKSYILNNVQQAAMIQDAEGTVTVR